ncbi:MAG: RpiB/LacA/LacB family sugar-phosphate isomerase [Patescibacteria group bacterium]|nr:RpiB/LacA/LacB family sugar-phosphate isomerase [Patescibacteria group bacterium]
MKTTIILASDHAGFKLKGAVKAFLESKGYQTLDVGAHGYDEADDYPEFMAAAAMKVASDMSGQTKAVILGGSGEGEAIVANRFPGVRAVVYYGGTTVSGHSADDIIALSRQHNDANVLSLGARFMDEKEAVRAVGLWLDTPFSGEERHARRIKEIDSIE